MTLFRWLRTAAGNGTADSTCPFPEGMSPSAYNDGTRGMMAAVAKYRDDIAGAIVTTGTLNAYSVSSFQGFDNLADMNGQMVAFTPHVTNGDTVTLNTDFLGAKPLRSAPGVELVAGTLVLGTPYTAVYNNTDGAWYLRGFFSSPYNVPFLGGMDFWDTVAPNSRFIFPQGQAISRTVYAAAFARWGTKFGAGDGSTTFNVPDKTGRVSAMMEAAAARLTAAFFGGDSTQVGAVGGSQSHTLLATEIPPHQHPVFLKDPGHNHATNANTGGQPGGSGAAVGANIPAANSAATTGITIGSVNGTANDNQTAANAGGGGAHAIVQPTIVCNYIIRIL